MGDFLFLILSLLPHRDRNNRRGRIPAFPHLETETADPQVAESILSVW